MIDLNPFQWALLGIAGFLTVTVISYVILRRSEKHRPVSEWTDEHWRAR